MPLARPRPSLRHLKQDNINRIQKASAMAKEKKIFLCNECGYDTPKWAGKCPACGAWNSFVEKTIRNDKTPQIASFGDKTISRPVAIDEISADELPRMDMNDAELNRVLGGGLVPGSLILLGGEPGIGKSTLILQTVLRMGNRRV